ncbi:MAG TPA: xanthine dehydrogenase family protein subunit M [Candidatus Acidoferrales bacterium]|nr:xanthine dehydrogenase family protein subunit M [Candidatus Acidoferrales bacterium]
MNDFTFVKAQTTTGAITAVAREWGARYVAGGTNILDLMKDAVEAPPMLVDINALPLREIEWQQDRFVVGALARMSDVAGDPQLRGAFPAIAIALDESASPQLRNMASIGGNVLQRTRCAYFRDPATPCNKRDPGSGCGAIGGENRRMAVLGTSEHCIATHASDLAVALAAFDARIEVVGTRGTREIPVGEFYRLPGSTPQMETRLAPGELITAVIVPALSYSRRSTYLKVRDRAEYEFALASAAVAVDVANGTIREARVALGGIATVPWRSPEAERALAGAPAERASFERAAEAALTGARGYGENDYKIVLAKRTLVRALEMVTAP